MADVQQRFTITGKDAAEYAAMLAWVAMAVQAHPTPDEFSVRKQPGRRTVVITRDTTRDAWELPGA